jgi:hypothetical protein
MRRNRISMVMLDIGNARRGPGNTGAARSGFPSFISANGRARSSTARAASDNGTRCSRPPFILVASTVRALEFAALTAARTGEVLGALWGEIDLAAEIFREYSGLQDKLRQPEMSDGGGGGTLCLPCENLGFLRISSFPTVPQVYQLGRRGQGRTQLQFSNGSSPWF